VTNNRNLVKHGFVAGGTLGDFFIVLCKLHNFKDCEINLLRYSVRNKAMDLMVHNLIALLSPNVKIKTINVKNNVELDENLRISNRNLINTRWDGECDGAVWYKDPKFIHMEPFPEYSIRKITLSNKKNIGIQLHSGKMGSNFKGFSLSWIDNLVKELDSGDYQVFLLGTGAGYKSRSIEALCKRHPDLLHNLVGAISFDEWVSHMCSLDFLISTEGFSSFFSMSQKVITFTVYTDSKIVKRIHPEWRDKSIIVKDCKSFFHKILNKLSLLFLNKPTLLSPMKSGQVAEIIKLKLNVL